MNEHLSLKERLALAGVKVERVYNDKGVYLGVRLVKNGHQLHTEPRANYEYGLKIAGFFGV